MPDQDRIDLIEKATVIINDSKLSDADKQLLTGRVPFIADTMLSMFVEVCEEDPFGIDGIVKSLKKKLEAQGNLGKLHEVMLQEKREIEEHMLAGA